MQQLQANNLKKWASKRKATEAIWVSPSDPDTAVGRDKEKVFRPLYNVQVVDDLDSPLILAYAVFGQQSDAGLLGSMLQLARQQLGHDLEVVLADTTYAGGMDLAAAVTAGVTLYAPVPVDAVANPKQIPKRQFLWLEQEQTYVCPQGQRLEFEESWKEKRVGGAIQVWRYRCPPEHCQSCPLRAQCTRTPQKGRAVTRQKHEELIETLRARMGTDEAKRLYRLRSQNVELVNADWKEHRKLRRFSGRGLGRAGAEVGLVVLAHNLLSVQTAQEDHAARRTARDHKPGNQHNIKAGRSPSWKGSKTERRVRCSSFPNSFTCPEEILTDNGSWGNKVASQFVFTGGSQPCWLCDSSFESQEATTSSGLRPREVSGLRFTSCSG
jgi:hypothetical protein